MLVLQRFRNLTPRSINNNPFNAGHYGLILPASGLSLLPCQPQANLDMVLSSSFPGHKTCPRYTARMQKTAVTNHMMTSRTVKALATPLIASLCSTFPTCIVASVSPALGKMNAHQFSEKDILRIPTMTAMVVMMKNQYANNMMKKPAIMPMMRTISPSGTTVFVK